LPGINAIGRCAGPLVEIFRSLNIYGAGENRGESTRLQCYGKRQHLSNPRLTLRWSEIRSTNRQKLTCGVPHDQLFARALGAIINALNF
jgi:hypothetical protein